MYEGDFAPVGDVAFRAPPRDLWASAKQMREYAIVLEHDQGGMPSEQSEYLFACALWYEELGSLISEIRLLPEVLAKTSW